MTWLKYEHVHEKTNNLGSDQVQLKSGCTVTEDGLRLEIFRFRQKRNCTIRVAKTKALISFIVTFAYADCGFSHAAAQISLQHSNDIKRLIYVISLLFLSYKSTAYAMVKLTGLEQV